MATNIYVLRLEKGKYYVGKTANVVQRYQQHLDGKGSAWTKKYKPIELKETLENVSPFEEDKKTKELMAKYGINNVRGGSYVTETLEPEQFAAIQQEIWAANDCCTLCGRKGHFVKDCRATTDINGNTLEEDEYDMWECEKCGREFESETHAVLHERNCRVAKAYITSYRNTHDDTNVNRCFRCGLPGHFANACYARTYTSRDYDSDSSNDY